MKSALRMLRNQTTPVPYAPRGGNPSYGLMGGSSSMESWMRAMMSNGTVYAVVRLLATAVARPDWHLYRKQTDGRRRYASPVQGQDQRTEVTVHQALKVWSKPNPFQTQTEFIEASVQYLELVGESDWVVERAGSVPVGLWPVRPDRLTPVPHETRFLAGWIYNGPNGEKIPLGTDEVIQIKYPNPLDPYRGLGPIQTVLLSIDSMRYGQEWNRQFFINSATPGGLLKVDKRLNDKEWDELQRRWGEGHKGIARAHSVGVLESGADWIEVSISQKDMEFAELINLDRDLIREAFAIHKQMLGNADDVNRANAQTAEEVFVAWQEIPRLNRVRNALNDPYLSLFGAAGAGVEFDYDNPSPEDREADARDLTAKSQAAQLLASVGVWNPDDILKTTGLPAMRQVAAQTPAPPPAPLPPASGETGQPAAEPLMDRFGQFLLPFDTIPRELVRANGRH